MITKIALIIVAVVVVLFMFFFVYEKFFDLSAYPPPPYFIENPKHEYTIKEVNGIYWITFLSKNQQENELPIGRSDYDLSPYVNKTIIADISYPKSLQD